MINKESKEDNYFKFNDVSFDGYKDFKLEQYLKNILPKNKSSSILDIGCGFGQMLHQFKSMGYKNLKGIDLCGESCNHCKKQGLDVERIKDIESFCKSSKKKYDFILMANVLEHIKKDEMISTMSNIKKYLLKESGEICIVVPNAQSNTGAYWLFEDFTHQFLFTARSLSYVLKNAGFDKIEILDPDSTEYLVGIRKFIRKAFLGLYGLNKKFWNKITSSTYHKPSKIIYGFDIKALVN